MLVGQSVTQSPSQLHLKVAAAVTAAAAAKTVHPGASAGMPAKGGSRRGREERYTRAAWPTWPVRAGVASLPPPPPPPASAAADERQKENHDLPSPLLLLLLAAAVGVGSSITAHTHASTTQSVLSILCQSETEEQRSIAVLFPSAGKCFGLEYEFRRCC